MPKSTERLRTCLIGEERASVRPGLVRLAVVIAAVASAMGGCKREQAAPPPPTPVEVRVVAAWTEAIDVRVRSVGTLKAIEQVLISPEVAGLVRAIHFDEGTSVERGDLLVELDDSVAAVDVTRAEAAVARAEQRYQRLRSAFEANAATPEDLDVARLDVVSAQADADRARIVHAKYRIHAPFAGKIGIKLVSPGAYVGVGTPLAALTSVDPVEIEFTVPEVHLSAIRPGLRVLATTPAMPGRTYEGAVVTVSPTVERATRTVQLLARIPNPPTEENPAGELKPGMFMNVSLTTGTRPEAVVVPEQSLFFQGPTTALLAIDADGKTVVRRAVTVGERRPGLVEVLSGVRAGEMVVVEGLQKARPGQTVKPVEDAGLRERLGSGRGS
ncbi:MAG: efflux RND transporter periplasmic adaptor subunit [Phycisphaeraceae bacterium]|nr:efflux RND transporter periplasmic adaptor subunit [Phycisphaeraceae bacterium]